MVRLFDFRNSATWVTAFWQVVFANFSPNNSLCLGALLLILRIFIECFLLLPIGVLGGWIRLQVG
jgi:hypothetical protein